ncbi:MAG: aldolase/citrate lyase family protein [bacterium]
MKNLRLHGIPNSVGIAMATAVVVKRIDLSQIPEENIPKNEVEKEVQEFNIALDKAMERLETSKSRAGNKNDENGAIFDMLLLMGAEIRTGISNLIRSQQFSTKKAVLKFLGEPMAIFIAKWKSETAEPIEKAKAKDLANLYKYYSESILKFRYGLTANVLSDIEKSDKQVIVVSKELSPNDAAHVDPDRVLAVALGEGARTDHTIVLLKNSGVPTVYGLGDVSEIETGDEIIVDAEKGRVFVNPDEATKQKYIVKMNEFGALKKTLETLDRIRPTETIEGKRIHIRGNVDYLDDVEPLKRVAINGGIGLLRSERFYMRTFGEVRDLEPSIQESVKFYEEIAAEIKEEVVIRTIDLGEDKQLPYLKKINGSEIFKLRGLGLCLKNPAVNEIFVKQIEALLLASGNAKNIKIMFPMVTSEEQFLEGKRLIEAVMQKLKKEDKPFNEQIKVGAMIETRAAIRNIEAIAKVTDFLSIGTNDLTQDITGASRYDPEPEVRKRYDEFDPRVRSAIKATIEAGRENDTPVTMCGDMASNPMAAFVLLGLGLKEFSMDPSSIDMTRHIIRNVPVKDCEELVMQLERITTPQEARVFVKEFVLEKIENNPNWKGLAELPAFKKTLVNRLKLEAGENLGNKSKE